MNNRTAILCQCRIITERDLNEQPITSQELLDCMLLTAVFDKERFVQIKQAVQALAFCTPSIADICKKNLRELRRLPELLRKEPALLADNINLEDRQMEMTAAGQCLRDTAAANPAQADYLNTAADIMDHYWTPLEYEE